MTTTTRRPLPFIHTVQGRRVTCGGEKEGGDCLNWWCSWLSRYYSSFSAGTNCSQVTKEGSLYLSSGGGQRAPCPFHRSLQMASLYKGEYLDVSTLYIGSKIEDGFKLIRDQLSVQDNSETVSAIVRMLNDIKIELAQRGTLEISCLETIGTRLSTTNRHLKAIAPQPIMPKPNLGEETKESA